MRFWQFRGHHAGRGERSALQVLRSAEMPPFQTGGRGRPRPTQNVTARGGRAWEPAPYAEPDTASVSALATIRHRAPSGLRAGCIRPLRVHRYAGTPHGTGRAFCVTSSVFRGSAATPGGRAWEPAPYSGRHSTRRAGVEARALRRSPHTTKSVSVLASIRYCAPTRLRAGCIRPLRVH